MKKELFENDRCGHCGNKIDFQDIIDYIESLERRLEIYDKFYKRIKKNLMEFLQLGK